MILLFTSSRIRIRPMNIPHPIPYQGSKRHLATAILRYFPDDVETLVEPFAGSAAITIAAACRSSAKRFVINDINEPLIRLWREIIARPKHISATYSELWEAQAGRERTYYDFIRSEFNRTGQPGYLLYLLARCVKAAVRYNSTGEFNQSPDNRRKGTHPILMQKHIFGVSEVLRGETKCLSSDYKQALRDIGKADLVYFDPPYQGVCGRRDSRYLERVGFDEFVSTLDNLNGRDVSYIVSYDGRTGDKTFGKPLPTLLQTQHVELAAGRSSQSTLLGRDENTFESLYLSPALVSRLDGSSSTYPPKTGESPKTMEASL